MSSKSNSNAPSLKRKVQVVQQAPPPPSPSSTTPAKQIKKEPAVEKLKVDTEFLIFIEYNCNIILVSAST